MEAIEQAAMSDDGGALTEPQLAQWERIEAGFVAALPKAETCEDDSVREISDLDSGMQLSMHPGEIALSVPYWHTGDDAAEITDLMRCVVELVERETGLVAYDPQADGPFLAEGIDSAPTTMTDVHDRMAAHLRDDATAPERRSWWRRIWGSG